MFDEINSRATIRLVPPTIDDMCNWSKTRTLQWWCIPPNNNNYSPSMMYTIQQWHAQPIDNMYHPFTTLTQMMMAGQDSSWTTMPWIQQRKLDDMDSTITTWIWPPWCRFDNHDTISTTTPQIWWHRQRSDDNECGPARFCSGGTSQIRFTLSSALTNISNPTSMPWTQRSNAKISNSTSMPRICHCYIINENPNILNPTEPNMNTSNPTQNGGMAIKSGGGVSEDRLGEIGMMGQSQQTWGRGSSEDGKMVWRSRWGWRGANKDEAEEPVMMLQTHWWRCELSNGAVNLTTTLLNQDRISNKILVVPPKSELWLKW